MVYAMAKKRSTIPDVGRGGSVGIEEWNGACCKGAATRMVLPSATEGHIASIM